MKLRQLSEQIKQDALANFYLVQGEEAALLNQVQEEFQGILQGDEAEMNYSQFNLAEDDFADFWADATALPFFAEHRVVLVQNPLFLTAGHKLIDTEEKQLLSLLEQPVPGNVVVFMARDLKIDQRKKVSKQLKKVAEELDLPSLNEQESRQLIQQRLNDLDYQIDGDALTELVKRTAASYSMMLNQLPKLRAYALDSHRIDLAAVQGLVPQTLHASTFDLADAIMSGREEVALHLYRELLFTGEAPLRINALILGQLRLLLQVVATPGAPAAVANRLKVHPYRVKLAQAALRKYNPRRLRKGFLALVDVEIALKTSRSDPDFLFEQFILTF
ncbi:DNA polymerase III subunit delta [Eupransor demetentiae]|uniref:DNA polymerase III subunit delta n=1 Tax=Eupransor demetentiae TaxID=3109584 RepID=A0ABP0EMY6_9LACO|nr:DNA polymerase III [Lactobacillaceae bacterium LMG 33000]